MRFWSGRYRAPYAVSHDNAHFPVFQLAQLRDDPLFRPCQAKLILPLHLAAPFTVRSKTKKPCATDLAARTKAYRTPVLFGCGDGASTGQHSAYLTDPSLPEGFTVTHSWGFAPRSACRINACARCPFLFCFVICLYYNKYAVGNQACKRDFHGKKRAHASLSCHVHFFDLVLALSN